MPGEICVDKANGTMLELRSADKLWEYSGFFTVECGLFPAHILYRDGNFSLISTSQHRELLLTLRSRNRYDLTSTQKPSSSSADGYLVPAPATAMRRIYRQHRCTFPGTIRESGSPLYCLT
jgi:hypothetical protein